MKKNNLNKVAILIFTDGKKILMEKRTIRGFDKDQHIIPGGVIEEEESLEMAVKREAMEELGITPLDFVALPYEEDIYGIDGVLLKPFIISNWEGNFPKAILDEGNLIEWIEIKEALNSPVISTKKIVQALEKYLSKKK